ncbi:MAG TPA: IPT/TIG domain-containing protein [Actinomycetota bacterium]
MDGTVRHARPRILAVVTIVGLLVLGISLPAAQAAPAPEVTGFTPTCGAVGATVVISGSHFQGATLVEFNGVDQTTFTVDSANSITAKVPSGATTGKIQVTTPEGSDESPGDFTVSPSCPQANPPTISSFSPTSGPVGTAVAITGTDLTGTTSVTFNNVSAVFTIDSATKITATVPSGATTGRIRVTNPAGTATSSKDFTVTGAPRITSFSPTSGPVGTSVTINGTNLTGATSVKFNGVSASFTLNSASKITAKVPSGATSGKISVTTAAGTATSSGTFTVTGTLTYHARSITFSLRHSLVVTGTVSASDGYTACFADVRVKVQRWVSGDWRTFDTAMTDGSGYYRKAISNRAGTYRTVARKLTIGDQVCRRIRSSSDTYG